MKNKTNEQYKFETEDQKTVAVCIAVQKLGNATIEEISEKLEKWNAHLTVKKIADICKKLQNMGLFSVDMSTKDEKGLSVNKYLMKRIKVAVPEVANFKDIVDSPDVKPLIEELEKSKDAKKRINSCNYYTVSMTFDAKGVEGFVPEDSSENKNQRRIKHYRRGKEIVLYPYMFTNWLRDNMPLANNYPNNIYKLKFGDPEVNLNGNETYYEEHFIGGTSSGSGYKQESGKGSKIVECLPEGTTIKLSVLVPSDEFSPEQFKHFIEQVCEFGTRFGGGHKLSFAKMKLKEYDVKGLVWNYD